MATLDFGNRRFLDPSGDQSKLIEAAALAAPDGTLVGSTSIARLVAAAASTNATSVKASAGRVYKVRLHNAAAALRYLKLYDKASVPTVGTDTPKLTIALPASSSTDVDFGLFGIPFDTGIAFALTTGVADADTAALTANDVVALDLVYA
jgi:hypothetical protein